MSGFAGPSARLAALAERGLHRGRESWRALQVGAAIAIGQVTSADGDGRRLREPYPIVRVAEEGLDGFDPRERMDRLILTAPLDPARDATPLAGLPGDAPN
ncbi:MAG TPA: hypothetical protein VNP95_00105 [Thermomicrobiales bacterium]|jgi:hypothetical protein|nr:hypothetical protein [Thermomicrobiales bacterium]